METQENLLVQENSRLKSELLKISTLLAQSTSNSITLRAAQQSFVADLTEQITRLEKARQRQYALRRELEEERERNAILENKVREVIRNMSDLENDRDILNDKLSASYEAREQLAAQLNEKERGVDALNKRISNLVNEARASALQADRIRRENVRLKDMCVQLKRKCTEVKEGAANLRRLNAEKLRLREELKLVHEGRIEVMKPLEEKNVFFSAVDKSGRGRISSDETPTFIWNETKRSTREMEKFGLQIAQLERALEEMAKI
ncbi:uncharacterized protein SPPG_01159 [Spizellomyces punctatus DAOM BR117]|uniref:Uncharacterized protein n=1 Tax=Spizellomyces punctatus (strain DAOM BR117) TaxID=645134 RepID=A0A0L0HRJ2_SPIPD|nr:uncharacterized protein SPPG_01159 [Spizellomyces punctatus DAOM BR117]KND03693.1 hypothetical protein SPPG_01159 [Spizellomyces punctatus DAOM BR117]|eukprot:XP_016611732.1 hypothetical protein SPPG_01159 [Spizellomyces punctatus DAOM BR117]